MKFIIVLCIFSVKNIFGQSVISGKIVDNHNSGIPNVTISYKRIGGSSILGFTKSLNDGSFSLNIEFVHGDTVQLEFSHVSHERLTKKVRNKSSSYLIVLQPQVQEIKEIRVKNDPVFRQNDTINYNVNSFVSKQDRVIADVLRKLPGIEMEGDQIIYQGKPIQKFTVNNLDLMEGRYGVINNNLDIEAVKNVQIVENDQPIKILDSVVFSDRASLNLELKKITSTGAAKLGVGLIPMLWDVNLSPMTFGKNFQMLNSIQSNNVGEDASVSLRNNYSRSKFTSNENLKESPSYISLQDVMSPDLSNKKWLNNKLFLFNTNVLKKLSNEIQIKGNLSYYNDTQRRIGFTSTQYFAEDQVFYISEDIKNEYRFNVLDAGIVFEKNDKTIYFHNNIKYHKSWQNDFGNLLFNKDNSINQTRKYSDEIFQNSLNLIYKIGSNHIHFQSTTDWSESPQRLIVLPGQFENILNGGDTFDEIFQKVKYKSLSTRNVTNIILKKNKWRLFPAIGLNYERKYLFSELGLQNEDDKTILGSDYSNNGETWNLTLLVGLTVGWETDRWKFNFASPFNIYSFNVKEKGIRTLDNTFEKAFNPTFSIYFLPNQNNQISTIFSSTRSFAGLDNFYSGYILGNYRSLQRFNGRLLRNNNQGAKISYAYKNPLNASFANLSYSFSIDNRDYIFDSNLDSLGRTTISIGQQSSNNNSHQLSGGVSRFLSSVKTVIKLNSNFKWSRSDYILNGNLSKLNIHSKNGILELINSSSSVISGELKAVFGETESLMALGKKTKTRFNNYFFNILFYPLNDHIITLNNSYYQNNLPGHRSQYFLDVKYSFKLKKLKMDFEVTASNIFNNNRFGQQVMSDIQLVQTYFELRPRQILFTTKFKF